MKLPNQGLLYDKNTFIAESHFFILPLPTPPPPQKKKKNKNKKILYYPLLGSRYNSILNMAGL